MADDDEVLISARLQDGISAATARISKRVEELEKQLQELSRTFRESGTDAEQGLGRAKKSTDEAGGASRRARPPVRRLGDETARTGAKATAGAEGLDRFARKARKAGSTSRQSGRLLMKSFAFAGLVTGAFAFAGGLSAIGAGGAIAVGGLLPMVGIVAGIPGLFLAAKLGMWAFKLAGDELTPTLDRLKKQFTDLAPFIAGGGLAAGLEALADSTLGLAQATGIGLRGFGAEIGEVARETGRWLRSGPALAQFAAVFEGLRPVLGYLLRGVVALMQAFLNLVQSALPLTTDMARAFLWVAEGLRSWTAQGLANGRTAAALSKAWWLFISTVEVLVDVTLGVANVLRIAAGYSAEFGTNMADSARQFRRWTESAEGQARINRYFQDSLPALREMGRLLGMIVGGIAALGANQDVAPLLAQIRTEFAPALGELVAMLSGQGGLGPALITAATALVTMFSSIDFSGLTAFVVAVGQLAAGIAWISQNVPGANLLIGALLASMLGFKVLGPVFSLVGGGAKAFSWVWGAARGTENLSKAQKAFKGVLWLTSAAIKGIGGAFKTLAIAGVTALRTLSVALVTTPVGWIILAIMAIVAAIILLWQNCEWFRDAVVAVWEWIRDAAVAAWDWIVMAVGVAIDGILWYLRSVRDGAVLIWQWISDAATAAWNWIVSVVRGAIDGVAAAAMWLWQNAISPVWELIKLGAERAWAVVSFIVQTAVFVIAGIILILATIAEHVWKSIGALFAFVFDDVIMPVVDFFVAAWQGAVLLLQAKWEWLTGVLGAAWNFFYTQYIEPVITTFRLAWGIITGWISTKWNWLTGVLALAWNIFYSQYIAPVINFISEKWNLLTAAVAVVWETLTSGLAARWQGFQDTVGGVISWISDTWSGFTSWLGDVFAPVGAFLNGIWEGFQKAATTAADIVKGVWNGVVDTMKQVWNFIAGKWNSIPSITLPDWLPEPLGGSTFSLPKLPMLWQGGEAPGGRAIVGEHGPEPLVRGGRVVGMVGANGPEVAAIPRGGYVVPNLSTLAALPGLTRKLPAGVAAAVARSVPGYAGALKSGGGSSGDGGLRYAVDRLAESVSSQPPPVHLHGGNATADQVLDAWRKFDRERRLRTRYDYKAGG